ncbi:MAG: hypothetical protein RIS17_1423, partial [Pseudomonadota bacterium]
MTRILLSLAACSALALSVPALAQEAPAPAPQMSFGSWGVDTTQIDPTIRPGDDFFAKVNGKWIASTPIPAERSSYGAFAMLDENAQADVRKLVEELVKANPAPGTAERRIVDSYQSYLDTAAIDAAGLAPARPWLDRIFAAKDLTQVATLFGEPGIPSPLGAFVMVDEEQPDRYTVGFVGDGLGLPDRDYYLKTDAKSREIQQKYRDYLAFLLGKAGYADPANAAKAVYNLELGFAQAGWDRALSRNRDLTYNKVDRAGLVALAGGFPLAPMLEKSGLGTIGEFVAWQLPPDEAKKKKIGLSPADAAKLGGGIPAMFAQLEKAPLSTVQAWMAAHFLSANADVLPSDIDQASFAFYGKLLNGQQEQRPRWKRAIDTVESQLGEVLGKAYVERHFPASSKAAMNELVGNLKKA